MIRHLKHVKPIRNVGVMAQLLLDNLHDLVVNILMVLALQAIVRTSI